MADQTTYADVSSREGELRRLLARNWWVVALRGVLAILFGLIVLIFTGPAILSLVLVFSAYMLVDGIFAIISGVRAARRHQRWGLFIFEGIVDIIAAVLAFLWPAITVLAFVLLVAVWSLASGGAMLAAAFQLNSRHGRIWVAIGGLASMILGFLLIIAPVVGAIVLTWWIGAYALAFGVTLLVAAFTLRSRNREHQPLAQPA